MFIKHPPRRLLALLASAAVAAAAGSARAAMTFTVTLDDGKQTNTYFNNNVVVTDLGKVYTANGPPVVTPSGGSTTLNFNTGLSTSFYAQVTNSFVVNQSTDGHLVLDLHFTSPVSISTSIFEGGTWTTTGSGAVSATGGQLVVEAMDPSPIETHSANFATVFNGNGGWTATSTTDPFTGQFTDYQILLDNLLDASATSGGTADIEKKSFIITIDTGVGSLPSPEPASLGILGLGAAALFARRRR